MFRIPDHENAGKANNLQYSACYVLPVEDSIAGIFESIKDAAIIHNRGGTDFVFTNQAQGRHGVYQTKGVASGPVSFMKVFDAATELEARGNETWREYGDFARIIPM